VKLFVVTFLAVALSAFTFAQSEPAVKKPLTIEALSAEGGITGRGPENLQWSPDGAKLSYVQRDDTGDHGQLWYVDPASGEKKVLVSESKLATLSPDVNKIKNEREKERITHYSVAAYLWSPDSKHLLFDSLGQLWLYDLQSGTAVQFTSAAEPNNDPKFSPDGSRVAYVRDRNLYTRAISGQDEKQLTKDSDKNITDGDVDWVYQEELSVRSNYFWSPDSSQIVFMQMDETRVPSYPITDWLPVNAEVDQQKYPKPGDPNPSVRLGVVSGKGGGIKWLKLGDNPDTYIPRFGWVRDGLLWVQVLNRNQDQLDIFFVDAKSGHSRKVLSETSDTWINVTDDFKILKSGDRFLWSSWRDGHTHLYLYSFDKQNPLGADAKLETQLTKGDFEVLGLEAVDESAGVVYFSANKNDPRQIQLYSVKLDGSGFQQLTKEHGVHGAKFSDSGKNFADRYSSAVSPPRLSVCAATAECHPIWESRSVEDWGFRKPTDLEFKADDGSTLYGELLLPPNPSSEKIPLLVDIYGGPAGQEVLDAWGAGPAEAFNQLLAQHGFAIFSVDNRGTPGRGKNFLSVLKHEFGGVELKDQLGALDQLLGQYPALDKSRTCIYGWSNGGSMTLWALLHSEVFKCGISGAPVTDWHLYDSIYTERYLGLPKDYAKAYQETSMPAAAEHLHGSLLLLHGTSDDNVHMQNSIQMVNALIEANKQFRLMLFPNKTHGVRGKAAENRMQLMLDFFEQNLK